MSCEWCSFFVKFFLHWQRHLKMVDLTLSDSLKVMTCHWYKIIVCCPHLLTIFSSNRLQLIFDGILSKDVLFFNMCHLTWPVRTRQCLFIFCVYQKLTQLKSFLGYSLLLLRNNYFVYHIYGHGEERICAIKVDFY